MTASIEFFTHGVPIPQGSKRIVRGGMIDDNSRALKVWRSHIGVAFHAAVAKRPSGWQTLDGPICLDLVFFLPRPKGHYRTAKGREHELRSSAPEKPFRKPDKDKLERAVMDALTQCGAWVDDSRVTTGRIMKRYATCPSGAGVLVTIREDDE